MNFPELYDEKEAASILHVKVPTLQRWRWAGTGQLEYLKIGNSVRYTGDALRNYIAQARRNSTSETTVANDGGNHAPAR